MMNTDQATHIFSEDLYVLKSRVVVVICRPWDALTDDEKLLLQKILGSVRLSPAGVKILHLPKFGIDGLSTFSPEFVISFGAQFVGQSPNYELVSTHGFSMVLADDLSVLDDGRKKSLWIALKQMFRI